MIGRDLIAGKLVAGTARRVTAAAEETASPSQGSGVGSGLLVSLGLTLAIGAGAGFGAGAVPVVTSISDLQALQGSGFGAGYAPTVSTSQAEVANVLQGSGFGSGYAPAALGFYQALQGSGYGRGSSGSSDAYGQGGWDTIDVSTDEWTRILRGHDGWATMDDAHDGWTTIPKGHDGWIGADFVPGPVFETLTPLEGEGYGRGYAPAVFTYEITIQANAGAGYGSGFAAEGSGFTPVPVEAQQGSGFGTGYAPTTESSCWFDANWTKRAVFTADNTKVSGTNTDMPLVMDLSQLSAAAWTAIAANTDAFRVTDDDCNELPFEVVNVDTGDEKGEIHFKAPEISSSNRVFHLYYGNAGASAYADSDPYGADNVWPSTFTLVTHFERASSTDRVLDSTVNANDAVTVVGDPAKGSGPIGTTISLNASDSQWIVWDDNEDFEFGSGSFSIVALAYFPTGADGTLCGKGNGEAFRATVNSGSTFGLRIWPTVGASTGTGASYDADQWQHYVWQVDRVADQMQIYRGGIIRNTEPPADDVEANDKCVTVGAQYVTGCNGSTGERLECLIDELRIIKGAALDADWIATESNNQTDVANFWSISEESLT